MRELEEVIRKLSEHRIRRQRQEEDRRRARPACRQGNDDRPLLSDRKDFSGAINRFKLVVTQYQTTRHVEEALMRLTEAYMALGIVQEAQTAAAVLGHNFPDSPWYQNAYKLVKPAALSRRRTKAILDQQIVPAQARWAKCGSARRSCGDRRRPLLTRLRIE
jgi:outer membrane protein assembly factor BamD